jgi:hypothetical protein
MSMLAGHSEEEFLTNLSRNIEANPHIFGLDFVLKSKAHAHRCNPRFANNVSAITSLGRLQTWV